MNLEEKYNFLKEQYISQLEVNAHLMQTVVIQKKQILEHEKTLTSLQVKFDQQKEKQ